MDYSDDSKSPMEKALTLPLISIGLIIGYFISMSVVLVIILKIYGLTPDQLTNSITFTAVAVNAFIWIVLSFPIISKLNLPKLKTPKLPDCVKNYFIGFGIMYGSLMVFSIIISLTGFRPQTQQVAEQVRDMGQNNLILAIIGPALLIPIIEEILFRGILYRALKVSLPALYAALISAFLFGLAHREIDTIPQLTILGFIFAYIYEKSGSIWVPAALHATNNFVTIIILIYLEEIEQLTRSAVSCLLI